MIPSPATALIVGCGYVGRPLALSLAHAGHTVTAVRRSPEDDPELASAGIRVLSLDITDASQRARLLESPYHWVVFAVSSGRGGVESYERVFKETGVAFARELALPSSGAFVFVSSTSVYAQIDGGVVTESSPANGGSATSAVLAEAEQRLLQLARDHAKPIRIARLSGIYGPDRGALFHQYLAGEARMHGNGERRLNMIHQSDAAGAIAAILKSSGNGTVYNVTEDESPTEAEFFGFLSETLRRPMPPQASPEALVGRKRGVTNKQVSNRRLRTELGYQLRYPTFRQGYLSEIERLKLLPGGA